MRWKMPAGTLLAVALLVPAAPAVAQTEPTSVNAATCQTIVYDDIRKLVTIDLDTATDTQVRLLANQIMATATADSLTTLPGRLQTRLDGTPEDLRKFLKTRLISSWSTDLRLAVNQSIGDSGTNVHQAAQEALDTETADAYLAYLNDGVYIARAADAGTLKTYMDIRKLFTVDLDIATNTEVRLLANQIMATATADSLTTLPGRIQERLDGTPDDLRVFLKTRVLTVWSTDLRIAVNQTVEGAGEHVQTAAQTALDTETIDGYLGYLNNGLYVARAFDCA